MRRVPVAVVVAVAIVVATVACTAKARETRLESVLIQGVPHVKQKPDFCGEACVSMWLGKLGHKVDQDDVFAEAGVDPALGRGAYTAELAAAAERLGFRVGKVWHPLAAGGGRELELQFRALHADLLRGVPSIVCMHYGEPPAASEHFRLVLGYDSSRDEVIFHEPAEKGGTYRRMARTRFLSLWPLGAAEKATAIRIRLEPGALRVRPRPSGLGPADYAQHVMKLKERAPAGFAVIVTPPFVVLGDDQGLVRRHAEGTVRWTVEKLRREFFARDPTEILDVWLFRDDESYRRNALALFGDRPSTPYGYYSSRNRALVMNISTGGGTLVHEIVHPYMAANFPGCPSWFNEGLGSLFEQSAERDGRIVGLPNWRLPALQAAIRAGRVPSFAALMKTSDDEFYNEDPGTNYAQARYLCLYLQEKGLLARFYAEFLAARARDPTGYHTLRKVLGDPDMRAFQRTWEAFVLTLRFPS
jgi:hypothetical protein